MEQHVLGFLLATFLTPQLGTYKHLRHWQRLSSRFMTLVEELYPCWSWNEESQWRNSFVKKIKRPWKKKKSAPRPAMSEFDSRILSQQYQQPLILIHPKAPISEISFDCLWIFLAFAFNAGRGPRVFFAAEQIYDAASFQMVCRCDHFKPFAKPMLSLSEATLSLSWHHRRSSVGFGTSRGAWGWFCLPTICGFCSS